MSIALIPWFSCHAVLADAGNEFLSLELYDWNGEFFGGVSVDAMASKAWRDAIFVEDTDLFLSWSTITAKRALNVRDLYKGSVSLPHAPSIEADLDMDFFRYRAFQERSYLSNLCALPVEFLDAWRGRFAVEAAAICWDRAVLQSEFRY